MRGEEKRREEKRIEEGIVIRQDSSGYSSINNVDNGDDE